MSLSPFMFICLCVRVHTRMTPRVYEYELVLSLFFFFFLNSFLFALVSAWQEILSAHVFFPPFFLMRVKTSKETRILQQPTAAAAPGHTAGGKRDAAQPSSSTRLLRAGEDISVI